MFATLELIRQTSFCLPFCALTLFSKTPKNHLKTTSSKLNNIFVKMRTFRQFLPFPSTFSSAILQHTCKNNIKMLETRLMRNSASSLMKFVIQKKSVLEYNTCTQSATFTFWKMTKSKTVNYKLVLFWFLFDFIMYL